MIVGLAFLAGLSSTCSSPLLLVNEMASITRTSKKSSGLFGLLHLT
jgi:hypothetical protein